MFRVHCPDHGHDVLLGYRAIEAVANTERGIEVAWRCHCGARGTLRTGVARAGRAPVAERAATSDGVPAPVPAA